MAPGVQNSFDRAAPFLRDTEARSSSGHSAPPAPSSSLVVVGGHDLFPFVSAPRLPAGSTFDPAVSCFGISRFGEHVYTHCCRCEGVRMCVSAAAVGGPRTPHSSASVPGILLEPRGECLHRELHRPAPSALLYCCLLASRFLFLSVFFFFIHLVRSPVEGGGGGRRGIYTCEVARPSIRASFLFPFSFFIIFFFTQFSFVLAAP